MQTRREMLASLVALGVAPKSLFDLVERSTQDSVDIIRDKPGWWEDNPHIPPEYAAKLRPTLPYNWPSRAVAKEHGIRLNADSDAAANNVAGVTLDGVPIGNCVSADEREGWMVCYLSTPDGKLLVSEKEPHVNSVKVYGDVRFWQKACDKSRFGKMCYFFAEDGVLNLSEPV